MTPSAYSSAIASLKEMLVAWYAQPWSAYQSPYRVQLRKTSQTLAPE